MIKVGSFKIVAVLSHMMGTTLWTNAMVHCTKITACVWWTASGVYRLQSLRILASFLFFSFFFFLKNVLHFGGLTIYSSPTNSMSSFKNHLQRSLFVEVLARGPQAWTYMLYASSLRLPSTKSVMPYSNMLPSFVSSWSWMRPTTMCKWLSDGFLWRSGNKYKKCLLSHTDFFSSTFVCTSEINDWTLSGWLSHTLACPLNNSISAAFTCWLWPSWIYAWVAISRWVEVFPWRQQ